MRFAWQNTDPFKVPRLPVSSTPFDIRSGIMSNQRRRQNGEKTLLEESWVTPDVFVSWYFSNERASFEILH